MGSASVVSGVALVSFVVSVRIRGLIAQAGRYDCTHTQLICFSGSGFNDKAHAVANADPGIRLVDLPTLYGLS